MVFEAFDASGEGILDAVELQLALSAAAPGTSLERLRICVLLKFGTWKFALNSLDLSERDLATPSALTAIAAPLDIPYEDIQVIYNRLDEDGDGELTWAELTSALNTHAEGFSIEELTLRAWNACESGKPLTQQAEQRLPRNHAADMPLAQDAFAIKVFGVQVSSQAIQEGGRRRCTVSMSDRKSIPSAQDLTATLSMKSRTRTSSAQLSTSSKPLLPTQPILTEAEALHAYSTLWNKHSRVTMNLLLAELKTHTFVSDVLALDRGQLHPGDTVVVKYRVPRHMEAQLNDTPFVAAVPQRMDWSPAGGGCWRLNGKEYTEIAGPRMVLPSKNQGVIQVQIPEMSALDNEPLEFRLFSSPDGRKPGKQVGNGARFVLRQVPPQRPHVVSAATTPTSVKLLWEPPPTNRGTGTGTAENRSFMVRGWPLDLNVAEMTPAMPVTDAWSHRNQDITGLSTYAVTNLVPGATYRFEVSEIRRDSEAGTDDGEKGSEGKEGPPSNALQVTLPLWSAPVPPGRPLYVGKGQAGERMLRWEAQVDHDAGLRSIAAPTLKHKLFWDIPPASSTTASKAQMVVQRGCFSFWPFPGTYWLREAEGVEGVIECKATPPMPVAAYTDASRCHFCVVAVSDGHEVHSEVSEAIPLPSSEEEVLAAADDRSMQTLAKAAVQFDGMPGLVNAMKRSGLAGDPDAIRSHIEQQKELQGLVQSAGGVPRMRRLLGMAEASGGMDRFLAALDGIDMVNFGRLCELVKRLQHDGQLDIAAWEKVFKLTAGSDSDPSAFLHAFEDLGHEKFMELVPRLLQEHMDEGLRPVDPWKAFAHDRADEMLRLFRDTELTADRLVHFLRDARSNGLIGPGVSEDWRSNLLRRLHEEAGGLSNFMANFDRIDLRCVAASADIMEAAQLTDGLALPRMGMWTELAHFIEKDWGKGIKAALELVKNDLPRVSQIAKFTDNFEDVMFHATQCGDTASVCKVLGLVADAGGAEVLLASLRDTSLEDVAELLNSLHKHGGSFEDLRTLVRCVNHAGGVRLAASAVSECNMDTFLELLQELHCMQSLPSVLGHRRQAGEFAKVLQKVYEGKGGGQAWLQAYAAHDLTSLAGMLPSLAAAGFLRSPGQAVGDEVLKCQAFLQWVAQSGGAAKLCVAVADIEASRAIDCMEVVKAMGVSYLSKDDILKLVLWLQSSVRTGGGIAELVKLSGKIDLFRILRAWHQLHEAEATNGAGDLSPGRSCRPQDTTAAIEALVSLGVDAGGPTATRQQLSRLDGRHLHLMVDLLDALRLCKPEDQGESAIEELYKPWMLMAKLAQGFGSAAILWEKVQAVNLGFFDECVNILRSAGLVQPAIGQFADKLRHISHEIPPELHLWKEAVQLIASRGGPKEFVSVFCHTVDLGDILHAAPLLLRAGMVRDEMGTERLTDSKDTIRIHHVMLEGFLNKVTDAGGFDVFWHIIKGLDLNRLTEDLHCLEVIRTKLGDGQSSDMWSILSDHRSLSELLDAVGARRSADESLTPKQQMRIVQKLREIDGPDRFMEAFGDINLAVAREQLRALADSGLQSIDTISELGKMGKMVRHDPTHLRGLNALVATLVQWMSTYQRGSAATMWSMLQHQVVWLLAAISNSSIVLEPLSGPAGSAADLMTNGSLQHKSEADENQDLSGLLQTAASSWKEVTPAKLAQFLNMLRPLGGVLGFLSAFQGLDLAVASAQARALHEAQVKSVDTAQRLANLFDLLHCDASQVQGLEYFVRKFAVPSLVESCVSKTRASEQWSLLSDCLAAAARCDVTSVGSIKQGARPLAVACATKPRHAAKQKATTSPGNEAGGEPLGTKPAAKDDEGATTRSTKQPQAMQSGVEHALDVLALGLSLDGAAELQASPAQWAQLCEEIRKSPQGLSGVLESLRSTANSKTLKPATCRPMHGSDTRLLCSKCGSSMEYRARRVQSTAALMEQPTKGSNLPQLTDEVALVATAERNRASSPSGKVEFAWESLEAYRAPAWWLAQRERQRLAQRRPRSAVNMRTSSTGAAHVGR